VHERAAEAVRLEIPAVEGIVQDRAQADRIGEVAEIESPDAFSSMPAVPNGLMECHDECRGDTNNRREN
jgi:hypothetical protein